MLQAGDGRHCAVGAYEPGVSAVGHEVDGGAGDGEAQVAAVAEVACQQQDDGQQEGCFGRVQADAVDGGGGQCLDVAQAGVLEAYQQLHDGGKEGLQSGKRTK